MKIAFEILPHEGRFALVRRPSGLILFVAGTEAAVRGHFMQNRHLYHPERGAYPAKPCSFLTPMGHA